MCMCVCWSFLLWLLCYLNSEPQRTIQHLKFLCSEQMPGLSLEEHTGIRKVLANGLRCGMFHFASRYLTITTSHCPGKPNST
uniref:Putative secreted protein n=1 Tax=Anopheles darlingi TaxID=43151 RepID=A0A2M4DAL6_ANODA